MKDSNLIKRLLLALGIIWLPSVATADIIYFKDGMKTVCLEKAWEENGEVKCEYDGVVLSYSKEDVDRIEKRRTRQQAPKSEKKTTVDKAAGETKADGLSFYDPRREYKYWTSKTDKHKTFQAAIAALAKQYDRPAAWIKSNMGQTNDLDQIHRNLAGGLVEKHPPKQKTGPTNNKVVEFYNPRRTHKYWTSETGRHDTFSQAVAALAGEFGRPTDWVKRFMGDVNDLDAIRQNLADRKKEEDAQLD